MSKRKEIFRPGDRVVIMQPHIFVRCGYPFDIVKETDRIMNYHYNDIIQIIDKIDWPSDTTQYGGETDIRAVASRLARIVALRNGYGGNERKIYTEFDAEILGKEGTVYSKRVVKTGERYAWIGGVQEGSLTNEKTHIILRVYGPRTMFEIEASNVRHVTKSPG